MNTNNRIKKSCLPATILIVLFSLISWQPGSAKEKASTIIVIESVLQELLEERCEIEADHRLAQDNPEKQTKDEYTYLCIHRWQVRLQSKE